MKKFLYIIFTTLAVANLTAQDIKIEIDSTSQVESKVEILAKIELKSLLRSQPVSLKDKIYTVDEFDLISCFDSTGNLAWQRSVSSAVKAKPAVADGQLAVGTTDGDIITLIEFTGEQIQSIGIDDSITTDLATLEYKGDKELFLPKQSGSNAAIIFGTKTGNIYCLDLETLQEYWVNTDSRSLVSSLIINENKILFTGSDGYLYSIDSRNGLLNWRWKETAETNFSDAQIICDGKKVFAVSKDFQLFCIDLLLGKLIWKVDDVKILPSIGFSADKKNLIVKSADRRVMIISADKGTVQKQIKRDDDFDITSMQPIEYSGKIYFTNNNSIFVLDKKLKEEVILNIGQSTLYSFQQINGNKFLVVTTDGTIILFRPR